MTHGRELDAISGNTAWNPMRFAFKHAVAATVVVGGMVLFAGASYFALLIWAVLAGEPLGGPLALPFLVLFALLAGAVTVLFVFLPTTAAAEWICLKRRMHSAVQIPVAMLLLAAYVLTGAVALAVFRGGSIRSAAWVAIAISAVLLVPLGAYWWSLQSTDWLLRMGARLIRSGHHGGAATIMPP